MQNIKIAVKKILGKIDQHFIGVEMSIRVRRASDRLTIYMYEKTRKYTLPPFESHEPVRMSYVFVCLCYQFEVLNNLEMHSFCHRSMNCLDNRDREIMALLAGDKEEAEQLRFIRRRSRICRALWKRFYEG